MNNYNPTPIKKKGIENTLTSDKSNYPIYPILFMAQGKLDNLCRHNLDNLLENDSNKSTFIAFVSTHLKDFSPEAFAKLYSNCLDYAATGESLKTRVFINESGVKPHKLEELDQFFHTIADYLGNDFGQKAKEAYNKLPKNWKVTSVARFSGQLTNRDIKISLAQVTGEQLTLKDIGLPANVGYVIASDPLTGCGY